MVSTQRILTNAMTFIDQELVPKMPKLEGIAFAAMAPFVVRAKLPGLLKMMTGTELVEGENVDIDRLVQEFRAKAQGKWPVELAGFTFHESDLDTLYRYLQR